MCANGGKFSEIEQGDTQYSLGPQEEHRMLHALGQTEELLPESISRLQLPTHYIKLRESPQHREELRRFSSTLTQLPRPCVCLFHFRSGIAFSSHERHAQGNLQCEFLLSTLGAVWEGLEQL